MFICAAQINKLLCLLVPLWNKVRLSVFNPQRQRILQVFPGIAVATELDIPAWKVFSDGSDDPLCFCVMRDTRFPSFFDSLLWATKRHNNHMHAEPPSASFFEFRPIGGGPVMWGGYLDNFRPCLAIFAIAFIFNSNHSIASSINT